MQERADLERGNSQVIETLKREFEHSRSEIEERHAAQIRDITERLLQEKKVSIFSIDRFVKIDPDKVYDRVLFLTLSLLWIDYPSYSSN